MAKRPKLTPWFPREIKPVRVGYYEIQEDGALLDWRRWWSGSAWLINGPDAIPSSINNINSKIEWRGLAEPPEGEQQ